MHWNVVIDNDMKKYLLKIPKRDAFRIAAVLQEFATNPYAGDIEKMEGEEDTWRRRIGSYRILYKILTEQKIINVADIRRRTSNTY